MEVENKMALTKIGEKSKKREGIDNPVYDSHDIGLVVYMRDLLEEIGFYTDERVDDNSRHIKYSIGYISKPIVIVGYNAIKGYSIYFMGKREYKVRKLGGVISYEYMENYVEVDKGVNISIRDFTDKILGTIREVWVSNNKGE